MRIKLLSDTGDCMPKQRALIETLYNPGCGRCRYNRDWKIALCCLENDLETLDAAGFCIRERFLDVREIEGVIATVDPFAGAAIEPVVFFGTQPNTRA
jgi:hypothetical protein